MLDLLIKVVIGLIIFQVISITYSSFDWNSWFMGFLFSVLIERIKFK